MSINLPLYDAPQNPPEQKSQESSGSMLTATAEPLAECAADEPPNGGYGWVCTAAAAIINMHSWGFSSAYAVFLANYLDTDTFPGTTALEYAFIGGLSLTCLFLVSPVATLFVGRFGIRPTMFAGMLLESVSLVCASLASRSWHLFLTQGVLFGLGLGLLFIPTAAVIPQWFTTRRSLATGFALAGAAFGGTVYSLAAGAMISNLGLHWALRTLGILAFVVNTSMIILIRDRNKTSAGEFRNPFQTKHFNISGFWLLIGFGGFTMLGYFILIFTLASFANHLGLDSSQASIVSAIFNLGQTVGRPLVGYLSDRFGRINMAAIMTLVAGVLPLTMWVCTQTYATLVSFAMLEGIVGGVFWAAIAPLMIEVVGMRDVAFGLTPMWISLAIPCTFSEVIALAIVEDTGSYLGTQLFTGFMYIAAASCLFVLRGWKIDQLALKRSLTGNGHGGTGGDTSQPGDEKSGARSREFFGSAQQILSKSFRKAKV
ncbi:major facilitator superfamily domain, general substrate transporter [Fusarium flagelliforme]|uniref:Major facilitator superfamily domain, general substrate transporter n=1 Tax=Fusarium flagelliforme TaxID=2675880 RepID=A0A395MAQ5_9HYPO|nr:major facilitator superfamily domain, general substrate transporter [Fusarium flagelliforme]